MKQSKRSDRKEASRERILKVASQLVRKKGFHGVGVAEVMNEAGLTHGGFYAHFDSRDDLLRAAVARADDDIARALDDSLARLTQEGVGPFRSLVETYLSDDMIAKRERGCPVAALSTEMPNQPSIVLEASRSLVRNLHRRVIQVLPGRHPEESAWTVTSTLIGALQLARILGDNDQGRAVLADTRRELLALYDT